MSCQTTAWYWKNLEALTAQPVLPWGTRNIVMLLLCNFRCLVMSTYTHHTILQNMWYHIFLEKFHRQEDCITAKASPTIILEFISWYNVWCQLPLNAMWSWKTRKTVDVDCPSSEASPITWDFPTLPTHFYKNVGATISPPVHRHELHQGLVFCLCRCDFLDAQVEFWWKKLNLFQLLASTCRVSHQISEFQTPVPHWLEAHVYFPSYTMG